MRQLLVVKAIVCLHAVLLFAHDQTGAIRGTFVRRTSRSRRLKWS